MLPSAQCGKSVKIVQKFKIAQKCQILKILVFEKYQFSILQWILAQNYANLNSSF